MKYKTKETLFNSCGCACICVYAVCTARYSEGPIYDLIQGKESTTGVSITESTLGNNFKMPCTKLMELKYKVQ